MTPFLTPRKLNEFQKMTNFRWFEDQNIMFFQAENDHFWQLTQIVWGQKWSQKTQKNQKSQKLA